MTLNPESEAMLIEQQEKMLAGIAAQVETWKPQPATEPDPFDLTDAGRTEFLKDSSQEFTNFVQRHFEPTDNVCFCLIHPTAKIARNIFKRIDQVDPGFVKFLHEQNEVYNIYVSMNAYDPALTGESVGRTEQNVVAVRNLYAEVDEHGEQTVQKIITSPNVPNRVTDILESSPGKYQFMWRVDGVPKDVAKATNRAIASEFDTDMASTDLARVLRVPGFKNVKYPEQPVVKIISESPTKYSREQFNVSIRESITQVSTAESISSVIDSVNVSLNGPPIPHGQHDRTLFRIGCSLRNDGWEFEQIKQYLVQVCQARCVDYGPDYLDMCEKKAKSACTYSKGQPTPGVIVNGHLAGSVAALGLAANPAPVNWRDQFKSIGELEQGDVRMLIDGFLPEGTIFIGGLPGEGKTLFALSIAKALTTGDPFLGKFFVNEIVPVIYLIPESGGRAFRRRCETFKIPNDPDLFLCRTVSEGSTLPLDDGSLLEAVRRLRPVIVLDTLVRFSEAEDENQAMQNKKLVDDIIRLRQAGAVAVIGLHHATKAMREKGMTLETALRGTGDIAASADAVYGLLRDSMLYNNGLGPNEIDVACLKPRDFEPPMPFRIAATQKTDRGLIKLESVIDRYRDFLVVSKSASNRTSGDILERLVKEDPVISLKELSHATGMSTWEIRKALKARHWTRPKGGTNGAGRWTLAVMSNPGHPADVSFEAVTNGSVN
jgi:hypothetical protein